MQRLQAQPYILLAQPGVRGRPLRRRRPAVPGDLLRGRADLVAQHLDAARHMHLPQVVAEVPLELSGDGGNRIGDEGVPASRGGRGGSGAGGRCGADEGGGEFRSRADRTGELGGGIRRVKRSDARFRWSRRNRRFTPVRPEHSLLAHARSPPGGAVVNSARTAESSALRSAGRTRPPGLPELLAAGVQFGRAGRRPPGLAPGRRPQPAASSPGADRSFPAGVAADCAWRARRCPRAARSSTPGRGLPAGRPRSGSSRCTSG